MDLYSVCIDTNMESSRETEEGKALKHTAAGVCTLCPSNTANREATLTLSSFKESNSLEGISEKREQNVDIPCSSISREG